MIVLKGHFASVIEVAVGFDHEPLLPPEEVDEIGTDANVDLGRRQTVAAAEPQEVSLQVAAGPHFGVLGPIGRPSTLAWRIALRRSRLGIAPSRRVEVASRRSAIVRPGVVTGMP